MIEAIILVVFPFSMAFAAMSDFVTMTIANRISILLIVTFSALAPLTGMAWGEYGMHFAAMALVLTVCFCLFATGSMGGGDAKLLAATALWMGFGNDLVQYLITASLLGGALTLMILNYRQSSIRVFAGQLDFMLRLANPKEKVPYGIALGIAGLIQFPSSVMGEWVALRLAGV